MLRTSGLALLHVPCEGQPGTLHWLSWKTGFLRDLKKINVGHIQRLSHKDLVECCRRAGFAVEGMKFCYHLVGQFADLLTHSNVRARRRVSNGQGRASEKILARLPIYRLERILGRLSYWESKVLGNKFPGMGADVVLRCL